MKKVLTIEDDLFLKDIESSKFAKSGYDVHAASTNEDVDQYLETATPDAIILDMMLPGVDSFELLKKFKTDEKTKAAPVIVFSNLSTDADMKKMTEAGAAAFMIKSNFTLDEVIEKIKELIGE